MSEPRTIRVKAGGFVSLERGRPGRTGPDSRSPPGDRTVALDIILTPDEAVALGLQLLRRAVRSRTGRLSRSAPEGPAGGGHGAAR